MNSRSINSHSSYVDCSKDGNKLVGSWDTANSCSRGNDGNGSTIISSDSSCTAEITVVVESVAVKLVTTR
jgi:hypothetical protein